jgi:hypothetical protein
VDNYHFKHLTTPQAELLKLSERHQQAGFCSFIPLSVKFPAFPEESRLLRASGNESTQILQLTRIFSANKVINFR